MRHIVLLCTMSMCLGFMAAGHAAQNSYWESCSDDKNQFLKCDETRKICSQVASVKVPEQDKPNEQERKSLAGCSSDKLYYGYGETADPAKARKCAYLQIEQKKDDSVFDGKPILMTVYANGEGVKRNLNLALKFACDDEGFAPAEYEGRIEHVNAVLQGEDARRFDYCDDITSGYMQGFCASRQAALDKAQRNKKYLNLVAKWTEREKQSFEKMLTSWRAYLKAREDEVDQSGTARAAMTIEDQETLEKDFLNGLSGFESGKLPNFSEQDYSRSDHELNLVYKKIQSGSEDEVAGTVTKEQIKLAQRAWLKYRDAWITFAKQKYPSVTEASWKTQLTRERTKLLEEFIN